jgi:hypothetical protein
LTHAVEPRHASTMATYDRLDWHYDSAMAAGRPPENAFTHIGFYLAWIIRHDLHNPIVFPTSHVVAVKGGDMTGSDLSDDIDTKLIPNDMNAEGRAFTDARYAAYLAEYATVFADQPDYAVVDDPANYARIAPVIDWLYASWIADGRPKAVTEATRSRVPGSPSGLDFAADMGREQIDSMVVELAVGDGGLAADEPDPEVMSRLAPTLEALIPSDLTDPPLRANSVRASVWGSSLLNRALRRLEVEPSDATVVVAMGGRGPRTLTVILYEIPTITAERLLVEVESAITLPPRGRWSDREVAGRKVRWSSGVEFTVAFWARDGLVVHVAGSAEDVQRAAPLLP